MEFRGGFVELLSNKNMQIRKHEETELRGVFQQYFRIKCANRV